MYAEVCNDRMKVKINPNNKTQIHIFPFCLFTKGNENRATIYCFSYPYLMKLLG